VKSLNQLTKIKMISLIIPTYNEAKNIKPLLKGIKDVLKERKYEIIIVDDDSPDKTWLLAESFKKIYPVTVIHRTNKRDLSSAVIDGFNIAKGEILAVMDADLSHSPKDIPKMLHAIEKDEYDFVIGSRLIQGGRVELWPLHRKLISIFGRILARPLTPVKDVMSGFFSLKKEVINNISLKPQGYKIGLEIIVKGNYKKIKEVPIIFKNREKGKSKMGLIVHYKFIVHLVSLYLYKLSSLLN